MTPIPSEEIVFHPVSFADPNGRVFWWKKELYRGVHADRSALYRNILQSGLVKSLVERRLLIETEPAPVTVNGYDLILKHRALPFVSYPFEWCGEMLKDAALTHLDLELELSGHGLSTQDAHPWNVLFDGARSVFVDFGSIYPCESSKPWVAFDQFCRYFLYPLYLFAAGHGRIARALLFEADQGVLPKEYMALCAKEKPAASPVTPTPPAKQTLFAKLFGVQPPVESKVVLPPQSSVPPHEIPKPSQFPTRAAFIQELKRVVEAIELPMAKTEWSSYYDTAFPPFTPSEKWSLKHQTAHKVLTQINPGNILDVGSNRGWYAQLSATLGNKVVAFDIDEVCVSRLHDDAKKGNFDIVPLVMSFLKPSPSYGLNHRFSSASERLSCDFVLGLAIVHHLVFKSTLNFEQITAGLAAFSKRWLLTEFIPKEDKYVSDWKPERYPWYTLENFQKALSKHYRRIEVMPSVPSPRVFLLCEK